MDLRLRNRLSQISPTTPNMGVIQPQPQAQPMSMDTNDPSNEQSIMARLAMLFHPTYEAQDQLKNIIGTMPQRTDYPVGHMRQIGAALAGLGTASPSTYERGAALGFNANMPEGMKVQSDIKDKAFNEATSDWARKLEPLEKLANIEHGRNVNERGIASNMMLSAIREGQLKRQERQGDERTDILSRKADTAQEQAETAKARAEISDRRANAYIFDKMHPNLIKVALPGSTLKFHNPKTGEEVYDTGLDTGKLDDQTKSDLQVQNKLKEISATGEEQRKTEEAKQPNRIKLKTTTPGKNLSPVVQPQKPLTPSAAATDKVNKAIKIINENPELKKYFVHGGNKKPTGEMTPDTAWFGMTDRNNYLKAKELFLGNEEPAKNPLGLTPPGKK